ncbi:MAG: hypothetical protein M0Q91_16865 [Methanoregula sp.]|jgi:predicted nucleic acid-binding protein|nr:hypothetical protein [Methanoregula sp.]
MDNFSSCVIDTSVIIKALFSPSQKQAGITYSRELKTHKSCVALLAVLDDHGIEIFLPRCGLIEIAAVSTRLANTSASEERWNEIETSFTIVPEDRLIEQAKKIAINKVARVLTLISWQFPNRIHFPSLRMIWECTA